MNKSNRQYTRNTRKPKTQSIDYSDAVGAWVVFEYAQAQHDMPPMYAIGEIQEARLYKGAWHFMVAVLNSDGTVNVNKPRKDVGLGAFVAKIVAGRHIPLKLEHEVQKAG